MSQEWHKPAIQTRGNIMCWATRELAQAPPHDTPENQEDIAHFKRESQKFHLVPDDQRESWAWVCKIHIRAPAEPARAPDKGVNLNTAWITSTASFVAIFHAPEDASQWLMTAAHNVTAPVYEHDDNGVITKGIPALSLADAIYIEAGWGSHKFTAWADRVAIMKGFFDDPGTNLHLDGAAIHIRDSNIPAAFWRCAPSTATLTDTSRIISQPLVIAGFPGGVEGQGLYLSGSHSPPFQPVQITPGPFSPLNPDHVIFKFQGVPGIEGFSGGPLVVGPPDDRRVIALMHTEGMGVPLVHKNAVGVDLVNLLEAIGGHEYGKRPSILGGWCQLL